MHENRKDETDLDVVLHECMNMQFEKPERRNPQL
jgi:hypothetical protein